MNEELKKLLDYAQNKEPQMFTLLTDVNDKVAKIEGAIGDTDFTELEYLKGDTPSEEEILNVVRPLIPDPIPGKDGYTPVKGVDYFDGKDGETKVGPPGKDGVDGRTPVKGLDYFDGKDGESITGPPGKDGKDGSPDSGVEIVDKINILSTDDETLKIEKKHIKGLDKMIEQDTLDRAIGILDSRTSFLINKVNNLPQTSSSGVPYTGATQDVVLGQHSLITTNNVTINRSGNYISSVNLSSGRTLTVSRTGNYINSITDGTRTWTMTRNGSNQITNVTV